MDINSIIGIGSLIFSGCASIYIVFENKMFSDIQKIYTDWGQANLDGKISDDEYKQLGIDAITIMLDGKDIINKLKNLWIKYEGRQ